MWTNSGNQSCVKSSLLVSVQYMSPGVDSSQVNDEDFTSDHVLVLPFINPKDSRWLVSGSVLMQLPMADWIRPALFSYPV